MLSRATLLSGQQSRALVALCTRATATSAANNAAAAKSEGGSEPLFRRPVRQEPGKVRMGFVPEEWFQFLYKKTGVTGPYTLGVTLSTYLISKEIYVLEHEFYTGLSLIVFWVVLVKKLGPPIAKYLDKEIDEYEKVWNEGRINEKQVLEEQITDEEKGQKSMEGQMLLLQAKRENIALQLEAAYRQRLLDAYNAVRKRLDFQVEKENVERRIAQKNIIDWVVRNVMKSFTSDQDKQNIDRCITDLAVLAKSA